MRKFLRDVLDTARTSGLSLLVLIVCMFFLAVSAVIGVGFIALTMANPLWWIVSPFALFLVFVVLTLMGKSMEKILDLI